MCTWTRSLRWALVFLTLTTIKGVAIPDVTLISQKLNFGSKFRMTCVVNANSTDSAIIWNEALPFNDKDVTHLVSEFIPPRNSPYNCNINVNSNEECNKYWAGKNGWTRQSSFYSKLGPVSDYRWEEFKIYYTSNISEIKPIAAISARMFKIHISVRTKEGAHIYLCDNEDRIQANCYWIFLEMKGTAETNAIKMCKGIISRNGVMYTNENCKKLTGSIQRGFSYKPLLSEMEWNHFTIEKHEDRILVWHVGKNTPILSYTNTATELLNIQYLNIRSEETPGFWKLHQYTYAFTNTETTTFFGPIIEVQESSFCMAFFVAMCSSCKLQLEVIYNDTITEVIIKTVLIEPREAMIWQEEKLLLSLPHTPINIQLRAHSICTAHVCGTPFWAIDDFQVCSEKEIRILPIEQDKDKASCQIIKYPQWRLTQTEIQHSLKETDCLGGTFGKSCIECSVALGKQPSYCENVIICEMESNRHSVCRCAMGYTGVLCEKSLAKVEDFSVISVSTTTITITWDPPQVEKYGEITQYNIRYKHMKYIACGSEQQMNEDYVKLKVENTTFVIKNLHPYSEYVIEIVPIAAIAGAPATTNASTLQTDLLEESELPAFNAVESGSTYVKLKLNRPNCSLINGLVEYYITPTCSNNWCSQDANNTIYFGNDEPLILYNLRAFSNYTIRIQLRRRNGTMFRNKIIQVHTKPAVPNIVRNITVYSKNTSSISIRFLAPYPPNGEIEQYYINSCISTHTGTKGCKSVHLNHNKCKLWNNYNCATLQKLESQKSYIIGVYAKNVGTAYNNRTIIVHVQTTEEKPGILENLTSSWDNDYNLTLTWGHPDIINAPLTKFTVVINSEYTLCYNKSFPVNEDHYSNTYSYVIPFDKCYSSNLYIRAAAFNIAEGPAVTQNVLSPPITPSFSEEPSLGTVGNTTIIINLPQPNNLENDSVVCVIVSYTNSPLNAAKNIEVVPEVWDKLDLPNKDFSWIAATYDSQFVPKILIIGNDTKSQSTELHNKVLRPSTSYTISIIIINEFGSFKRYKVYTLKARTASNNQFEERNESTNYGLFALLLLLILPLLLWYFIRKRKHYAVSGFPMFYMNRNFGILERGTETTDDIPLTKRTEKNPGKIAAQFQFRYKKKIAVPDDSDISLPSTSIISKAFSNPIKIIEFEKYLKESIENGELERQHQFLPRGQTKPWDYGLLPQNKSKNRYNNLVAYDHTRVKLTKINSDPYSDYINANYIEGYNAKKTYIATQGPKASTVNDFWRMIWEENVKYIVMLANVVEEAKKKNEQYWPNVNEYLEFGNIKVEYISSRIFEDYECRTFLVSSDSAERRIQQLHFTSWPDRGVPLYSHTLVPFIRKMLTIPQGNFPIVVHCSAGVGRTGTIILCDLCLRMAGREGVVDVLKHQYKLREQRVNLVDNIEQYKLVHLILLECLVAPQTTICCDEEMEEAISRLLKSERVTQQVQYLNETTWLDQVMRPPLDPTPVPEWIFKNRFQDIVPWGYGHVKLSPYPLFDEHSNYINAVEVDGFRFPQKFIVTQQPLLHTVSDFWRMIDEKEVTTIVSLNEINFEDETSCIFWPTENDSEIQPVPFLTLQLESNSNKEYYNVATINLCSRKNEEKTQRVIKMIILKGWPANNVLPNEEESLLKLWQETEALSEATNRIVVTCYDGAKACGLFIALSIIISKMKFELECDVCSAIRTIRHNRTKFVAEIDQFLFLYRAAIKYFKCFDLYSNIVCT